MVPSHAYVKLKKPHIGSESRIFCPTSMKTWRKLGLSVTPKSHIFEDHEKYSMQAINGLGDKTKYFIELYRQNGAYQYRGKQGLRDYKQKHESQHKTEHRSSHPKVQEAK